MAAAIAGEPNSPAARMSALRDCGLSSAPIKAGLIALRPMLVGSTDDADGVFSIRAHPSAAFRKTRSQWLASGGTFAPAAGDRGAPADLLSRSRRRRAHAPHTSARFW